MIKINGNKHKLFVALLLLAFLSCAILRWSGELPYGSDTDEHLLVAQTMLQTGQFSVRNIHGTKYPPIISGIIMLFSLVGLDSSSSMIFANCFFILSAILLFYWYVCEEYRIFWLGEFAALYIMSNIILWNSVHLIIADSLFFFFVTVVLLLSLHFRQYNSTFGIKFG